MIPGENFRDFLHEIYLRLKEVYFLILEPSIKRDLQF